MCSMVPFATTAAILASSMTLVGIAVDRYYAVMKAVIGFWNPSIMSSCVCMFCIWLASFGIASPVFFIYQMLPVYILTEDNSAATVQQAANEVATTIPTIVNTIMDFPDSLKLKTTTETATSDVMKYSWSASKEDENLSIILVRQEKLVNMCISEQVGLNGD